MGTVDRFWDDFWDAPIDEKAFQASRQKMTERFARYGEMIANLLERAAQLKDDVRKEELKSKLWRQRYRLKQGPVRLLVLGASSAGKSTLINALAGKAVSPEGRYTTTCVPAWIVGVEALDSGSEGPAHYTLKYFDEKENFLSRANYLHRFCKAPGGEDETEEEYRKEYIAVYVKTVGGFLKESGITLLDTPGVGQEEEDTHMAIETAALGAEMLLLVIRNNVFDTQENRIYSELFPGGKYDLGLDPPREVFCLFNEEPLVPMTFNVVDSFRNLTVNQSLNNQVDTQRRLYSVNVLMERRKHEAYLFSEWAPDNVTESDDAYLKIMEKEDKNGKEIHGILSGASPIKGYGQLAGKPPSESMQRLMDDLRIQAQAIYADPERICGPIEAELRAVAEVLLEDCGRRIRELTERTGKEIADIPGKDLTSTELLKLRGKLAELMKFEFSRLPFFNDVTDEALRALKKSAAAVSNSSHTLTNQIAEDYLKDIPLNANTTDENFWNTNMIQQACSSFVLHLGEWRGKLSSQVLMENVSDWANRENVEKLLQKIFLTYNDLVRETQQFIPDIDASFCEVDHEVQEWTEQLVGDAGECLTTEQTLQEEAAQMGLGMTKIMSDAHVRWNDIKGFLAESRKRFLQMTTAGRVHSLARSRLISAMEHDLKSYVECMDKNRQAFEQDMIIGLKEKIRGFADRIDELRLDIVDQIKIQEETARGERLQEVLQERGMALLQKEKEGLQCLISGLVFSERKE